MTLAGRSSAPILSHLFRVRVRKINMTLVSLVIHVGTMTNRLLMLGIELLERFHLAKVKVIPFFIETVEFFRRFIVNYSFALLS